MSVSANQALNRIKVAVETVRPASDGQRLHRYRRAVQWGVLLVAVLIPVTGLFRIDPAAGAFVVLDRQIWFSDFFIVIGFWLAVSSLLVMTYSTLGTAFCGWACPQNTFSEWANRMTQKFLGKHAAVSLTGEVMHVSAGKKKWMNWLMLGGLFLTASLLLALIPLLYFYPPDVVLSFLIFRDDARLAASLHWIYTVFVLIILVDIAVVRYFFCRFMCIYRVWQHSFKTRQTLHIAYDEARGERCASCNFCLSVCPVEIDPRNTSTYDSCINCGACISACDSLQYRVGEPGLLSFEFGERKVSKLVGLAIQQGSNLKSNLGTLLGRFSWSLPLTVLGAAMFAWGLLSYQPYHLSVYRADTNQGTIQDYRIGLANKLYKEALLKVRVEGLPAASYQLSANEMAFTTVGRKDLNVHIAPVLAKGLHPFIVHVEAQDGWRASYRVQHFVSSESKVRSEE